jgi:hypothetical protein
MIELKDVSRKFNLVLESHDEWSHGGISPRHETNQGGSYPSL